MYKVSGVSMMRISPLFTCGKNVKVRFVLMSSRHARCLSHMQTMIDTPLVPCPGKWLTRDDKVELR